jgi:N-acetyl sugar amidotransferase
MHPLTVTWAPHIYTDIGWQNLQRFIHSGFDHILGTPNGRVHRTLTRLAFEYMGDPFQPFIYGQVAFPLRMAILHNIPVVMYGEDGEAEYGGSTKNADRAAIDLESDATDFFFSAIPVEDWVEHHIREEDLLPYRMPAIEDIRRVGVQYHHFSYYKKWTPQENFYYAAKHCGFQPNPQRNEGTYSKYASLDDRIDGFHYYLMFIKFGIGRATSDAAHEIRDDHLTREEGVALVRKYDGEFPARYFEEFLEYTELSEERFHEVIDSFRQPHIWDKVNGEWKLKSQVS